MAEPGALAPIPRGPEADPAFDLRALYDAGLARVRTLAHATWTDHNTHDPGLTMLEVACYALTELAYRASLPIEDLVVRPGDSTAQTLAATRAQFLAPADALGTRPWTEADWRRTLIDLPGVKNAWLAADERWVLYADLLERRLLHAPPAHPRFEAVVLRGLQQVRIEFAERVTGAEARDAVLRSARERLRAQRNLCEQFTEVQPVQPQFFAVCAEIELQPGAATDTVAAQLLFALSQQLSPPVPQHTLAAMQARGFGLPEILEGPRLAHGAIDSAELAATALPTALHLSDLYGTAMDVPGVQAIRDLRLNPLAPLEGEADLDDGAREAVEVARPWRVPVATGRAPRLSLRNGRFVFTQRGLPVAGWSFHDMPAAVRMQLDALLAEAAARTETPTSLEPPFPLGRAREVAAHRSIQADMPALYGLGEAGLPVRPADAAGLAQRRVDEAHALQLRGWLLFFDQWLADQQLGLADASRQLSLAAPDLQAVADGWLLEPAAQHVRRSQPVTIAHHDAVARPLYTPGSDAAVLSAAQESPAEALQRQQRTLSHLLARVGENLDEDLAVLRTAFDGRPESALGDQCRFLAEVALLQHERAGAHDVEPEDPAHIWNTDRVSGLEHRIARRLGIADFTRRNLGAVSYDTYAEIDSTPGDEFRWRVRDARTRQIVLSASQHHATPEAAREEMIRAIERGQRPEGYQRAVTRDERHYFNIVDATGEVIGRRIQYFATPELRDTAIAELLRYLREHYSGEGLYVIEHILLRPQEPGDPLLPICTDPGCDDGGTGCDTDPYSHRLHIVLPAYAGRFQQMGFRAHAEDLLRQELPAHLLPTICWVDAVQMAALESAWHTWLEILAGTRRSGRAEALQALIDALTAARNTYPERRLFDCTGDAAEPPFVLGKTALGRLPSR